MSLSVRYVDWLSAWLVRVGPRRIQDHASSYLHGVNWSVWGEIFNKEKRKRKERTFSISTLGRSLFWSTEDVIPFKNFKIRHVLKSFGVVLLKRRSVPSGFILGEMKKIYSRRFHRLSMSELKTRQNKE